MRDPQIRGEVEFASRLLSVCPCGSTSVRVHGHGLDVGSAHHSVGTGGAVRCSPAGCDLEVGQRLSAAAAACRSSVSAQLTRKRTSATAFQNNSRYFTRIQMGFFCLFFVCFYRGRRNPQITKANVPSKNCVFIFFSIYKLLC